MLGRKDFIIQTVKEAGEIIKQRINEDYKVSLKKGNNSDLVTAVDVEIEKFLVEKISEAYPTDAFLTEERTVEMQTSDYLWIVDPIDGTMNFVYSLRDFAISIALYYKGVGVVGVVYDVMADEMFIGVKDEGATLNNKPLKKLEKHTLFDSIVDVSLKTIMNMKNRRHADFCNLPYSIKSHRNLGSAALRICHIASNRIHIYLSDKLCAWDVAAGLIILEEVGGYHNYLEENKLKFDWGHYYFLGATDKDLYKELKAKFYY